MCGIVIITEDKIHSGFDEIHALLGVILVARSEVAQFRNFTLLNHRMVSAPS